MKTLTINLARMNKIKRAARFVLCSVTFKKLVNAGIVVSQMMLGSKRLYGYPFVIKVEASNRCNLRCEGCYSHDFKNPFPKGEMTLELFKKIVDDIGDYLFLIKLYVWGEPLLNNDIFDMVSYARKKRIAVAISTNLNTLTPASAKRLVGSGLNHLIAGIDGVTQSAYEKTRIRGDIGRAIKNLGFIINERGARKSRHPFIEWQYIVTASNEHEALPAKTLAQSLGVDRVSFIPDGRGYAELSKETMERYAVLRKRPLKKCYWLWCMSAIQWQGAVMPCCYLQDSYSFSFGNMAEKGFKHIWNGPSYQGARGSFRENGKEGRRKKDIYSAPDAKEFEAFAEAYGGEPARRVGRATACHMCSYYKLL
ncbi:MAG: SPASM domain-containing protein [Deltaproteobacteria bacterium]|nr:SPASM domain-containing protein [Deltaproteobacteria bacterium]